MTLTDADLHLLQAYDLLAGTVGDEPMGAPRVAARIGALPGGTAAMGATFAKVWAEARSRGLDVRRCREIGYLGDTGSPA